MIHEVIKLVVRMHCKKCGVLFDAAGAGHSFIRVIDTPAVSYDTPLV